MIPAVTTTNPAPANAGSRGWLLAAALSLAVSLAIVAPFFWLGSASGHDFEFHVSSWLDVSGQWKEGIAFPRWAEWANHGFGEPRFIFYPPLSWLLAPALKFFVPWNLVPVVFIVLVQTFAGLAAFAFSRRLLPDRGAIFAAVCYAANPNALLIVYMRSDFAELLASAFFPLLFLAALRLVGLFENGERRQAPPWRLAVTFATIFAAVWLSNAPAGVMATYSVVLLFAGAAFAERSCKPLARGAAGVALGFGLAGFYLVPAAYEQRWVNIGQVLSSGLLPSQNFLYTTINDPEHNLFNWIASTSAVIMIVTTGIAALRVYRSPVPGAASSEAKVWRVLLLIAAAATFTMLRPSAFLWEFLPKLRFVQFPWRWMSILALPFAYFLGAVVAKSRLRVLWIVFMIAVLFGAGTFFVRNTWWDADDVATLQAGVTQGNGFDGTDEYDPVGDDHYNLAPKAAQARILLLEGAAAAPSKAQISIDRWTAEDRIVRVHSPEPVKLALRLLNYPAWRIELNGAIVTPEPPTDSNQMILALPAGQSQVRVHLIRTPDHLWGLLLTVASVLLALGAFFKTPAS
jgi:uncharacterized membrane protein